jgi:hypothetical protein
VAALRSELAVARARGVWSPGAATLGVLERTVEALQAAAAVSAAQAAAQQQAAVQQLLDRRDARAGVPDQLVQVAALQARYEELLAAKNAEVEGFRAQVDGLLDAARQLQQRMAVAG